MARSTFTDPETDSGPAEAARAPRRALDGLVWAGTAVLVAAAACAAGLSAGRHLPLAVWWDVDDRAVEMARVMAGLGGVYGLLAGGAAGLLRGRPSRVAAGLKGGLGFAVMGAFAGGSGPLLSAATGGRLPTGGASVLACALTGGVAGLVAYVLRRSAPEPLIGAEDDWSADPTLAERRPPAPGSGPVLRQWPILTVSAACLVVAIVTPPSPAGWPMIGIALLGFAVAWVLAGQERRLRELEGRVRQREADVPGPAPDDRPGG